MTQIVKIKNEKEYMMELCIEYGYIAYERGLSLTQAKSNMMNAYRNDETANLEKEVDQYLENNIYRK